MDGIVANGWLARQCAVQGLLEAEALQRSDVYERHELPSGENVIA